MSSNNINAPEADIQTSLGPIRLIVWGNSLVVINTREGGEEVPLIVNRVPIHIRFDIDRGEGDAEYNVIRGIYTSRHDTYSRDVSWAARTKLKNVIVEAVNAHLNANPSLVAGGLEAKHARAVEAALGEVVAAENKLTLAKDKLEELEGFRRD